MLRLHLKCEQNVSGENRLSKSHLIPQCSHHVITCFQRPLPPVNKTKDDLLNITFALWLTGPDSNTMETRAELISLINNHLDKNPHLVSDSAFAGLFLSQTCGRRRNNEYATSSAIPLPTLLPPPHQPLSSDLTGNASDSELESELLMVLFNELPRSGCFFQSITSIPPDVSLLGPSSFTLYTYYPPPVPHPAEPQLPPLFFLPPSPRG